MDGWTNGWTDLHVKYSTAYCIIVPYFMYISFRIFGLYAKPSNAASTIYANMRLYIAPSCVCVDQAEQLTFVPV